MINIFYKTIKFIFTILLFFIIGVSLKFSLIYLGFAPIISPISGTSMQPTLFNEQRLKIFSFNEIAYKIHGLKRGDLVAFSNNKTNGSEYIKRIIGLPGDTINISNGFVSVNDNLINEKYILKPRSTFGGEFANECKQIIVPQNQVFVLGDNRKRSLDSRDIGFVSISDIDQFLPFSKQTNVSKFWRDTSNDFNNANLSIFSTKDYYDLLNKFRKENKQKELKIDPRLEELAKLRANKLLKQYQSFVDKNDSDKEYKNDISSVGYSNIINQEISTFGFYEAEELMDYWKEKKNDSIILNHEFSDTGIASIVSKVNGCEVQIVVQEFGGYRPPNYSKEDIKNIENIVINLKEILPSWQKISTDNPPFFQENKELIEKVISIIKNRIDQYQSIEATMKQDKWLSNSQQQFISQDKNLQAEQEEITIQLNDKIKRENSN